MATRITIANLEAVVDRINRVTGSPSSPWRREGGRNRANIGNYHLSRAYGGVCLHRMANESGGVTTPLGLGHVPNRELYYQLHAFVRGLEIGKGESA